MKVEKFSLGQKPPTVFARQIIKTDCKTIDIPVPDGFQLMTITEILEDITILQAHEKKIGN